MSSPPAPLSKTQEIKTEKDILPTHKIIKSNIQKRGKGGILLMMNTKPFINTEDGACFPFLTVNKRFSQV